MTAPQPASIQGQVYIISSGRTVYGAGLPVHIARVPKVRRDSVVRFCRAYENQFRRMNEKYDSLLAARMDSLNKLGVKFDDRTTGSTYPFYDRIQAVLESLNNLGPTVTLVMDQLIASGLVATAETGPDGEYQFKSIPSGEYTLFAESEHQVWWKEVTIRPGENIEHLGMQTVYNRTPFHVYKSVCETLAR